MKIKYYNIILSLFILTFFSVNLLAGPRSKKGLSAAPELLIPVGSIGTSLNGSNLSNVSGVEALYWNPAGLGNILSKGGEVQFSHQRYIADININYFGAGYKLGNIGNIGVSIKSLGFGDIPITTVEAPDGTGETYSPTYITAGVTFARAMTDRIYFGVTGKIISERIVNESAVGFAADLGLQYIVGNTGLKFGVALKNLGPSMRFDGIDLEGFYPTIGTPSGSNNEPRRVTLAEFELPTSLSLGLSYDLNMNKNNMVTVNGLFQNNSFSADDYVLGLEYNFKKIFYLRGSYNFDQDFFQTKSSRDDRLWGTSFGAGVKYNFKGLNVGIDYALRLVGNNAKALGQNHFFTVGLGF